MERLPAKIAALVGRHGYTLDGIGCTEAEVRLYEHGPVLKIETEWAEPRAEREMTRWLQGRLEVPRVLADCVQRGRSYLLLSRLPGEMACAPGQLRDPERLVRLLARGLRRVWALDTRGCPGDQRLDRKLERARRNLEEGRVHPADVDEAIVGPQGRFPDFRALWAYLDARRPAEDLVFTHGDYCLPNVLLEGEQVRFLDLGRSGIADRWQDVALCLRSLAYNLGTDAYRDLLLAELGLPLDREKLEYYLLLDELF